MRSPFVADGMVAEIVGEDGRKQHIPLEKVTPTGTFGFAANAAVIGEEFKALPDTEAVKNARELKRLSAGAETDAEAETARRKKGFVPYAGTVNPYKDAETAPVIAFLPRRGTPMAPPAVETAERVLTVTRAILTLRDRLGDAWDMSIGEFLQKRYPDGVPESVVDRYQITGIRNQNPDDGVGHVALG
jgi:hypothetical protein